MALKQYEEVKDIFGKLFCDDEIEKYWYQYTWSILEKNGLTIYDDSYEETKVFIYGCVLIYLYREFFRYQMGENWYEDYLSVMDYEFMEMDYFFMGQLCRYDKEYDQPSDVQEIFPQLVSMFKGDVYQALLSELTVSEIYHYIVITASSGYFVWGKYDKRLKCTVQEEYAIDSLESYIASIKKIDLAGKDSVAYDNMAAFSWLMEELG